MPRGMLKKNKTLTRQPLLVLLYILLYIALLGLVTQPMPLGALKPRLWRMTRLTEVRAAIRLLRFGMRNPNFISLLVDKFHYKYPLIFFYYILKCDVMHLIEKKLFIS